MYSAVTILAYKEAAFKEALMTSVRPTASSVVFDKKIEPKDKAMAAPMNVGIKPGKPMVAPMAPVVPLAAMSAAGR